MCLYPSPFFALLRLYPAVHRSCLTLFLTCLSGNLFLVTASIFFIPYAFMFLVQRPRCLLRPSTSSTSDSLSPPVATDLDALLALLVVADRFDIRVVTTACTELLNSLLDEMTPAQAEGVVSLPSSVRALPGLYQVDEGARKRIREVHSPAFDHEGNYPETFLALSEAGLGVLLTSTTLDVDSEDSVLEAAVAWADHQTSDAGQYLGMMAQVILPRVRITFLSPKCTLWFTKKILSLLQALPSARGSSIESRTSPLQAWASLDVLSPPAGLPEVAMQAVIASSQVAHCLVHMRAAGIPVPSNILEWLTPGSPQLAPRAGCRPQTAPCNFASPRSIARGCSRLSHVTRWTVTMAPSSLRLRSHVEGMLPVQWPRNHVNFGPRIRMCCSAPTPLLLYLSPDASMSESSSETGLCSLAFTVRRWSKD